MDAIAVVLALEDYQNSIAKNLKLWDVAVDIYGWLWFFPRGEICFPTRQGERIFFTRQGEGIYQTGGEIVFHIFKSKAIEADQ